MNYRKWGLRVEYFEIKYIKAMDWVVPPTSSPYFHCSGCMCVHLHTAEGEGRRDGDRTDHGARLPLALCVPLLRLHILPRTRSF